MSRTRFHLSLLLGALLVLPVASNAMDTYPRQPGVKPEHYAFALTLNDANDEILGEATVSMRFTNDGLTSFFLDLANAANGKGMTVTGVTSDNVTLRYTHAENHLTITLDRPTRAGELRRFTIRYHGIPANGLRTGVNKYGERCFFSWNWPDKAREWLPMIDHPSAKATSEFIITAPEHYSVVANGLLQEEVSLGDGRKLTHWKESVPIASWLNAIGVERFGVHHAGYVKGVPLQTWVAHQELPGGIARFEATARRAIEFYSDYIGPYSYEKMASVTAPFNGGATEHASEVFYGDGGTWNLAPATQAGRGRAPAAGRGGARGGGRGAGRGNSNPSAAGGASGGVIAHEIAHQWFGDAVTESDWDDAWLSEGFATYFALLYDEHYVGHDAFVAGVRSMFDRARAAQEQTKGPLVHENISDLRGVIPQLVYQKGGSVLQMLRGQVGTEAFWNGIREYYQRHRNANASSDDLRRAFEETSGQDLRWFFDQWLHRASIPALEGSWRYDSAAKTIVIDLAQTQGGPAYRLPIEVAIEAESSGGAHVEKIDMHDTKQQFVIPAEAPPRTVMLDPNSWLLMAPPRLARSANR